MASRIFFLLCHTGQPFKLAFKINTILPDSSWTQPHIKNTVVDFKNNMKIRQAIVSSDAITAHPPKIVANRNEKVGMVSKSSSLPLQLSIISSLWQICHNPNRPPVSVESISPTHSVRVRNYYSFPERRQNCHYLGSQMQQYW